MITKKRFIAALTVCCVAFFGTYKAFSMRSIYKVRNLVNTINKIEKVKKNGILFSVSDYKSGLFHSTCVISETVNNDTKTPTPPMFSPFVLDIYNGPVIIHHGLHFQSAILISVINTKNHYQTALHTDVAYFHGYDIQLIGKHKTKINTTIDSKTKPTPQNTLTVKAFNCNLHLPKISRKSKPNAVLNELTAVINLNNISGKMIRPQVEYAIQANNIHINTDLTKQMGKITTSNLKINRKIFSTSSQPRSIEFILKNANITNLHMNSDEIHNLISNKSLQRWAISLTNFIIKKEAQKQATKELKHDNQTESTNPSSHVADSIANIISNKTKVNLNGIELKQERIKLHGNIQLSWPELKNKHSFQDVFTDAKMKNTLEPSFIEPKQTG